MASCTRNHLSFALTGDFVQTFREWRKSLADGVSSAADLVSAAGKMALGQTVGAPNHERLSAGVSLVNRTLCSTLSALALSPFQNFYTKKESLMSVPKAELHLHLEGAIRPSLVRKLAERNKIDIPEGLFASEDTFAWNDFLHFLKVYDAASSVLRVPEDYYDVTFEYLKELAGFGTIYSEIMPSPDHARLSGMSYSAMLDAVTEAMRHAEEKFNIVSRIVMIGVRHFGLKILTTSSTPF